MLTGYSTYGVDRPLFNAGAMATHMAAKLGTAVFSMVTSFWGGGSGGDKGAKAAAAAAKQREGNARAAAAAAAAAAVAGPDANLPHENSLADPRRQVHTLALSPLQVRK